RSAVRQLLCGADLLLRGDGTPRWRRDDDRRRRWRRAILRQSALRHAGAILLLPIRASAAPSLRAAAARVQSARPRACAACWSTGPLYRAGARADAWPASDL